MFFVLIYIAAITGANLSVATFGPWVSPVNSFLLIGLDLSLRDKLHDQWVGRALWPRMLGMIAAAGVVSWLLNPTTGKIALASAFAFMVAALADALVYQRLLKRTYMVRANGSNAAGALADSLLFPTIAFGGLLPHIVALQFAAKFLGGAVWSWAISKMLSWRKMK